MRASSTYAETIRFKTAILKYFTRLHAKPTKIEPAIPKNEYSSVSFNPLKNIGRLALTTSKLISNNSLMKIFQAPWKILKSINKKTGPVIRTNHKTWFP